MTLSVVCGHVANPLPVCVHIISYPNMFAGAVGFVC
jgi:hypothetical protein